MRTLPTTFLVRLALGLAAVGLVTWLAVTPNGTARRSGTLERLVRTGKLGRLDPREAEEFRTLITVATAAAGLKQPYDVNVMPVSGRLHFYVTDPELLWFTACDKGNAVYDAVLDTVFIDRSLWRPTELSTVSVSPMAPWYQPHEFAFTRVFLTFILLHELGHRASNHGGGLFDAAAQGSSLSEENSADRFAVLALRDGYRKGILGADEDVNAELSDAGFAEGLTPEQKCVAAVLYAASQMSIGLLFSRGSFSSLYDDANHPSFGKRVTRIADALQVFAGADPSLSAQLAYFRAVTSRVEDMRRHHFVEVHTTTPIVSVDFDDDGISIVDEAWGVWHGRVQASRASDRRKPVQPVFVGTVPVGKNSPYLAASWTLAGAGLFLEASDGQVFQVGKSGTIAARADLAAALKATAVVIPTMSPSSTALHLAGYNLILTGAQGILHSYSVRDILSAAQPGAVFDQARFLDSTIVGRTVHIPFYEHAGPFKGCIELDLENASRPRFRAFAAGGDIDLYGSLVAMPSGNGVRHFIAGQEGMIVAVWEISEQRPAVKLAEQATIADQLASSGLPEPRAAIVTSITSARFATPDELVLAVGGDSVFEFDPRTHGIGVAFHPGSGVRIKSGVGNRIAYYELNGFKAYLQIP